MTFKKTYKELKELSGMTEMALAAFHGVSRATIQNWVNGRSRAPMDSHEKLLNYVEKLTLKGE